MPQKSAKIDDRELPFAPRPDRHPTRYPAPIFFSPNRLRSSSPTPRTTEIPLKEPEKYLKSTPFSPLDQILSLYRKTNSPRTFSDDLAAHLRHGFVISTPEVLVLARPVARAASVEQINDPTHLFPAASCDTWYIYAFAGQIRVALKYFPYALPYIAFERANQNGLRFRPFERFLRKCQGLIV